MFIATVRKPKCWLRGGGLAFIYDELHPTNFASEFFFDDCPELYVRQCCFATLPDAIGL